MVKNIWLKIYLKCQEQLGSLRGTDADIIRLEAMVAMLKTARIGYARAAKEELADQFFS